MIAVLQTIGGLLFGGAVGFGIRLFWNWPDAPWILAACGGVGQACKAVVAYCGRPGSETHAYQLRIAWPAVAASACLAMGAVVAFLPMRATLVVPIASYLLVRVLLRWQHGRQGSISRIGLWLAALGGGLIALITAIMKDSQ